ncbi:37109_t:CDS:1, partial [Racocetra persica]
FMLCKHLISKAGGNSIKLTSIHRYTRYPFVYIEHVNTKPLDSSTIELDISSNSDNSHNFSFSHIFSDINSEDNVLDSFQLMVNDLKYLVTDLEKEIANGNNRHLKVVQHHIQKTLKIAKDIKEYRNRLANPQISKAKEWTMFLS